ncbi:MAG: XrtA/PEP-CTERM system histidine kinase PrsK, partial [Burkholderiales bacterium]
GLWAARGTVNALIVPLIAISAARNPEWPRDVLISRRVVFHSAALLGAGIYLLLMSAAGYYIRYFGGSWGAVFQATFLFGVLLLLLVMFSSGTLRARIRVYLNKNFFRYRYDYREEWLRFTRLLSAGEPGVRLRERSIEALAQLVESPAGALWLLKDADHLRCAAHWNMSAALRVEDQPSQNPLCRFLQSRQWVINIDDWHGNPAIYQELDIPEWVLSLPEAWLVVPLISHERLIGFVVLARSRGNTTINWEVNDLLKTAGRQAAIHLAQLESSEALIVAKQFEPYSRVSAYAMHDLKSVIAQFSLLLSNAEKHKHNPEFQQDVVSTVDHAVGKMKGLLAQLANGGQSGKGRTRIDLVTLLRDAVAIRSGYRPCPVFDTELTDLILTADPDRLARVLGHIIQNAIEATPAAGRVWVELRQDGGDARIAIEDNGRGMDERFVREKLFHPFQTTKGSGMGIGVFECREYVRELGGRIEVSSDVERGTTFLILLPLTDKDRENGVTLSTQEGVVESEQRYFADRRG